MYIWFWSTFGFHDQNWQTEGDVPSISTLKWFGLCCSSATSVYLSITYVSVQSDFRRVCVYACVCVYIHVCAVWLGKQNYISDQHKTAIGGACFHWPQISLNLIHTRRQRTGGGGGDNTYPHGHTQTHTYRPHEHMPIHPGDSHLLPCCANCLS